MIVTFSQKNERKELETKVFELSIVIGLCLQTSTSAQVTRVWTLVCVLTDLTPSLASAPQGTVAPLVTKVGHLFVPVSIQSRVHLDLEDLPTAIYDKGTFIPSKSE